MPLRAPQDQSSTLITLDQSYLNMGMLGGFELYQNMPVQQTYYHSDGAMQYPGSSYYTILGDIRVRQSLSKDLHSVIRINSKYASSARRRKEDEKEIEAVGWRREEHGAIEPRTGRHKDKER
jgi:hypothetical protein